jgi:exopolysaccharide biosynthesis polyprenyl glycosylphosphotransferase
MATFSIRFILLVLLIMILWNRLFLARKTEGRDTPRSRFLISQLSAVFAGTAACTLFLGIWKYLMGPLGLIHLQTFAVRCGAIGTACVLSAGLFYSIAYRLSVPHLYVIVGSRRRAIGVYKKLQAQGSHRGIVLGFVDPDDSHAKYLPCDYLGSLDNLENILIRNPVDMVYLALPLKSHYHTTQDAITICERIGVDYSIQPEVFETRLIRPDRLQLRGARGFVHHVTHEDYRILLKRGLDVAVAGLLLCVLAPLMMIIAIAIKVTSPGPILFVQERYGRNRRRFTIYKFRSMVANAEDMLKHVEILNEAAGPIFKIKRDPRITPMGRILRRSSLDELPQLFNVLKGDMALVGPRPMSLRDVHRFSEASLMRRFSVVPGITGLWQVSGRSNTDFDTWMRLDLEYIDHWSLGLDLKILLQTVPTVLAGTGAV